VDLLAGAAAVRVSRPGAGQPVAVIGDAAAAPRLRAALTAAPGIASVSPPQVRGGLVYLQGTLASKPDSAAAYTTVDRVRAAVHAIPGADAKVGFAVALGVLLDTLIVRSVLVTALTLDLGGRIWWPSRLAREPGGDAAAGREPGRLSRTP
jgi:hypothetical protein